MAAHPSSLPRGQHEWAGCTTFLFWLPQDTEHLCLGRILTQSPQDIPTLPVCDLHLALGCAVEQQEGLLELCGKGQCTLDAPPPRDPTPFYWIRDPWSTPTLSSGSCSPSICSGVNSICKEDQRPSNYGSLWQPGSRIRGWVTQFS